MGGDTQSGTTTETTGKTKKRGRWYARFVFQKDSDEAARITELSDQLLKAVLDVLNDSRRYYHIRHDDHGSHVLIYERSQSNLLIRLVRGRVSNHKGQRIFTHDSQPIRGGVRDLLIRNSRTCDYFRHPVWALGDVRDGSK